MNSAQYGKNGVGAIPERPFFRLSIIKMQAPILKLLIAEVDPRTMVVTRAIAEKIGLLVQGIIQRQIVLLRDPPNAQSTIDAKGSSNPLINLGFMRQSVTWRILG